MEALKGGDWKVMGGARSVEKMLMAEMGRSDGVGLLGVSTMHGWRRPTTGLPTLVLEVAPRSECS